VTTTGTIKPMMISSNRLLVGTIACFLLEIALSSTTTAGTHQHGAITKSLVSNVNELQGKRQTFHRVLSTVQQQQQQQQQQSVSAVTSTPSFLHHGRHLQGLQAQDACDASFVQCLPNAKCVDCFATLEMEAIDWTGVTPGTACPNVVSFLIQGGHCASLSGDSTATDLFCKTFDSCVIWNDEDDNGADNGGGQNNNNNNNFINCTALTSCEWEGMHKNWVGDGVCHDNMDGCYNTAICGFDGGDCCEDTCNITERSSYTECGHDGYACKDPASAKCNPTLTKKCPSTNANGGSDDNKPDPSATKCKEDETKYRLVMYDSFGDGWDATTLTIQPEGNSDVTFKGGLVDGYQGTEYICLSKQPTCYNVKTEGGVWGVEVSWEVRPMAEGSPALAGGGSPGDCDFSVAGEVCSKTCDGKKPDVDPSADPDYKSFKDLYNCIEDKCLIQLGACNEDPSCKACFAEDSPDYCYGVDTFVAVIDCTMCSCTEKEGSEFCSDKSGPGQVVPPVPSDNDENDTPKPCTPKQTMAGTSAIMDFSKCSDMDEVAILITDFDQNNFGQLDAFETCAHSFRDEANHGGHTALGCMKILKNAITNPIVDVNSDAPKEAISSLASSLYTHGETFCDCAKKASDACPLCPSFMSFKTILYESIDACQSLDAIDCDSWNEFWKPCKDNLDRAFLSSDFSDKQQCEYTKNDCGGAGAFPAFRRLDCEGEIPDEAWTFYKSFSKSCLKGADGIPPKDNPTPKPYVPSTPTPPPAPYPTPKPYVPEDGGGPKPYVPSDSSKPYVPSDSKPYVPSDSKQTTPKKKSKWFRNLMILMALGGIGYFVYKRRSDGFNFVQYRRRVFGNRFGGFDYGMVNTGGPGENEMYSNLNLSTSFEPPSLPPTPQMMMGGTEMT